MSSAVDHPSHYCNGKIECIDYIQDQKLNFCRGNAIKYIVRAGLKDPEKEIEDLEKAIFYLKREIDDIRGDRIIHQTVTGKPKPAAPAKQNLCVMCGAIIPEGMQYCKECGEQN